MRRALMAVAAVAAVALGTMLAPLAVEAQTQMVTIVDQGQDNHAVVTTDGALLVSGPPGGLPVDVAGIRQTAPYQKVLTFFAANNRGVKVESPRMTGQRLVVETISMSIQGRDIGRAEASCLFNGSGEVGLVYVPLTYQGKFAGFQHWETTIEARAYVGPRKAFSCSMQVDRKSRWHGWVTVAGYLVTD